nr:preprotein translocase subunit SecE [uncultured Cetobacterium sp.]
MGLINDVKKEYSKVQWPRKKEIISATTWVVVMSILLGVYLGVFDIIASRLLKMLVSLFGG